MLAADYIPAPKHQLVVSRAAYEAAKAEGEDAYHAGVIDLNAWHFFKELLDKCRTRGYCWYKVEKLSDIFKKCDRQIRRWFRQLKEAGLILREQTNREAHTYIAAFVADPDQPSFFAEAESGSDRTSESDPFKGRTLNGTSFGGGSASLSEIDSETDEGGIEERRTKNEEPRTRKTPTQATFSAGAPNPEQPAKIFDPAAAAELRNAGLTDDTTVQTLAQKPLDRIRAVIAYVRRQRNAGPGLIAYLLHQNKPIPEGRARGQRRSPAERGLTIAPQPTAAEVAAGIAANRAHADQLLKEAGLEYD